MTSDPEIKGFLEISFLDWPGKLSSVIFLPYCNLRCPYCHNWGLVLNPERYETIPLDWIFQRLREFKEWIDGVCITGGEPTLHPYLSKLLEVFKREGFLTKLDTNGTNPQVLRDLILEGLVDEVAMDLKGPLNEISYSRCTGTKVFLDNIRESIGILREDKVPYQFRITLVPTLLGEEEVLELAQGLKGSRGLKLQDFNPENPLSPQLKGIKPYGPAKLREMQEKVSQIINN